MKKGNISKPYYLYILTDFSKRKHAAHFFCKKRDLGFWQELHKIGFELGQFFFFIWPKNIRLYYTNHFFSFKSILNPTFLSRVQNFAVFKKIIHKSNGIFFPVKSNS